MGKPMTKEQIAKIHEWLGHDVRQCVGPTESGYSDVCQEHRLNIPHYRRWDIIGKLTDADAMECLRKLPPYIELIHFTDGDWALYTEKVGAPSANFRSDPAEAIFAAVLAYLEASND